MNHKLESRLPGETPTTSDMQIIPLIAGSKEELKSLLMRVKEENEKAGLKLNFQKTKIKAFSLIISWQIEGGKVETVTDFIFLGSQITADSDCSHEIKRLLLLGRKADNLDSILKCKDMTLPTKIHLVKAMVFPAVKYGCENWAIKKADHQRIDAIKLWCWKRLLRDQASQSKEIKQVKPKGNQP